MQILLAVYFIRKLVDLNKLFSLAPLKGVIFMLYFALGIIHCQRSFFVCFLIKNYYTALIIVNTEKKVPCGHVQDKWSSQQLVQNPSRRTF